MRKLYAAAALWLANATLLSLMITGPWPQTGPLSWLPTACGGAAIFLVTLSGSELRRLRRLRLSVITRICPQCLTPSCGCESPMRIVIRRNY